MRLFFAINLPDVLKKRLFAVGQEMKGFGQMKIVEEENIHLTLKFLGETEPGPVIKSLEPVKLKPFEVSLKGIGVFPSLNYIRVVWAGCEKGAEEVIMLHKELEKRLPQFERDRDFHPHATLARVSFPKDKQGLVSFLEKNKGTDFGDFTANSFELMKSELSRGGPKYEVVKSFRL